MPTRVMLYRTDKFVDFFAAQTIVGNWNEMVKAKRPTN